MGGYYRNNKKRKKLIPHLSKLVIKLLKSLLRFNEFNKHFTSIAKQTEEKFVKPKRKYCKYLNKPNTTFFYISPTNSDEMLSGIKELNNSKSTGPASIPSKFFKLFQTALRKPILLIANLSFSVGRNCIISQM